MVGDGVQECVLCRRTSILENESGDDQRGRSVHFHMLSEHLTSFSDLKDIQLSHWSWYTRLEHLESATVVMD